MYIYLHVLYRISYIEYRILNTVLQYIWIYIVCIWIYMVIDVGIYGYVNVYVGMYSIYRYMCIYNIISMYEYMCNMTSQVSVQYTCKLCRLLIILIGIQ